MEMSIGQDEDSERVKPLPSMSTIVTAAAAANARQRHQHQHNQQQQNRGEINGMRQDNREDRNSDLGQVSDYITTANHHNHSGHHGHRTSYKFTKAKHSKPKYLTRGELTGIGCSISLSLVLCIAIMLAFHYLTPVVYHNLSNFVNDLLGDETAGDASSRSSGGGGGSTSRSHQSRIPTFLTVPTNPEKFLNCSYFKKHVYQQKPVLFVQSRRGVLNDYARLLQILSDPQRNLNVTLLPIETLLYRPHLSQDNAGKEELRGEVGQQPLQQPLSGRKPHEILLRDLRSFNSETVTNAAASAPIGREGYGSMLTDGVRALADSDGSYFASDEHILNLPIAIDSSDRDSLLRGLLPTPRLHEVSAAAAAAAATATTVSPSLIQEGRALSTTAAVNVRVDGQQAMAQPVAIPSPIVDEEAGLCSARRDPLSRFSADLLSISKSGSDGMLSGTPFHFHRQSLSELISGRKHWVLYSPDSIPTEGFNPYENLYEWHRDTYPALSRDMHRPAPIEIIQEVGQVVYVPEGWYHATKTLTAESVSIRYTAPEEDSGMFYYYLVQGDLKARVVGDWGAAIKMYRVGLAMQKNNLLLQRLAFALDRHGLPSEAESVYKEALERFPRDPHNYAQFINFLVSRSKTDSSDRVAALLQRADEFGFRDTVLSLVKLSF